MTKEYTQEEQDWDKLVLANGPAHYMQSSSWAASKTQSKWPVSKLVTNAKDGEFPIQFFSRTVPGLGKLHYAPEVSNVTPDNLPAITKEIKAKYSRGLTCKIELYQPASDELIAAFKKNGWVQANSVQPRTTVIVDIRCSEDELLAGLKQRARYEIRIAQRNNVRVDKMPITPENLDIMYDLMNTTAKRSGAFFRDATYSKKYWNGFNRTGQGHLYFAYHEGDLLAAAFVIEYGKNAWYKDGGSVRHKSNMMAARFLHWEIMKDLQSRGIEHYDLCGIPSEAERETSSMRGLFVFKTAFSREITELMPAFELPFGKRYSLWPKTERRFLQLYSGVRKDFWY